MTLAVIVARGTKSFSFGVTQSRNDMLNVRKTSYEIFSFSTAQSDGPVVLLAIAIFIPSMLHGAIVIDMCHVLVTVFQPECRPQSICETSADEYDTYTDYL